LIAPSKTFNLAGLQCAFAIIPNPDLRRRFQAAREGLTPWVNAAGIIAAQSAYTECQSWLDEVLLYLESNRKFVREFVQSRLSQILLTAPEGTYLAWLDCRKLALESPYEFFLNTARVAFSDGKSFGNGGNGFVRLNFACPHTTLAEALHRMENAVARRLS
jgi:cystathionine beta-lyase